MFQHCKTYCLLFLIALLPFVASAAMGQTLFGKVTRVVDGDTIAFKVHDGPIEKVRLADIDTPERDQPWGTEATTALRQWSMSKPARIEVVDTDRYGRLVATLWVDDENINRRLVKEGHAWVYRKYLRDTSLIKLEARAKLTRTGLWSSNKAIKPSDWRRGQRSNKPTSAVNDSVSGPVKKSRSGICHAPGSTYYARTLNFKPFTSIE
ncbi:thermonuclease family protein, partial [Pseudomonadales bacterium]|nr:thermonuclease family protein [Pseudomonadales bacterium]